MRKILDLTGQKFTRLKVIKLVGQDKKKNYVWECLCDCGKIHTATAVNLRHNKVRSCGCLQLEAAVTKGIAKRLPYGVASRNALIDQYKRSAKRRNYEWRLSDNECEELFKGNCHYCGIEPLQKYGKYSSGQFIYNGIDRVNNLDHYYKANCVPCCKTCNRAKDIMSVEDFIKWIQRVKLRMGI